MKGFIDIHTHKLNQPCSIYQQLIVDNLDSSYTHLKQFFSIGIHPQKADQTNLLQTLYSQSQHTLCIAIGEAGIDRLVAIDMPTQIACFEAQIEWAIQCNKPLVVHCVKAFDILLALLKKYPVRTPWIIHGFRGKPALAKQLYSKGCYLSIGQYFNAQSVAEIPLQRLLLETDESTSDIQQIYQQVAHTKKIPIKTLRDAIITNSQHLFGIVFSANLIRK